jgi:hypothetical protein
MRRSAIATQVPIRSRHEAVDSKAVLKYVVAELLGFVTLTSDRKTVSGTATDVNRMAM